MRRRPGPALIAVALAAAVFVASIALPALGAPHAYTAASVASKVKKALGLAKAADVDSKRAMRAAERFGKGPAGPQGGQGEPGNPGEAGAGGLPGGNAGNGGSGTVGTPGAGGDAGDDAADGAPGFDGIPRKATPVLATTPTPTETATSPNLVEIPLDDASWTQGEFETDMVFASLTLSDPDVPNCDSSGSRRLPARRDLQPAPRFGVRADPADRGGGAGPGARGAPPAVQQQPRPGADLRARHRHPALAVSRGRRHV